MAVDIEFVNHDQIFNSLNTRPILVNEFELDSVDDIERFKSFIQTTYDSDSLEIHPRCNCEKLTGAEFIDTICDVCGFPCLPVTERPLESALWIKAPRHVKRLINPTMWIIMSQFCTKRSVNVLRWLVDPRYKPPRRTPEIIKLEDNNIPRGLNHFYENFDTLMEQFFKGKLFTVKTVRERREFYDFLQENRDYIFSEHIPVPSKLVFITEKTAIGRFADPGIKLAIDAVNTINFIDNTMQGRSQADIESQTVSAIDKLAEYYNTFFKKNLSPKEGWFRKHVYGTRGHMTFRAVITSIHEPHQYNELHLPWALSVMLFKEHIKSKLLKRGFTPNEVLAYISTYTRKFDATLNEIFHELMEESFLPNAIPVLFQRN